MVSTRRSTCAAVAAAASASKRAINDGDSMASLPTDDSSAEPIPVVKRAKKKTISPLKATPPPPRNEMTNGKLALFSLQDNNEQLVEAKLVCRPSKHNKSPYVADIELILDNHSRRQATCHVPSLDMGGKCVPGSKLLVRAARDKKGCKVSADAVSPKYGTPKCEFISQLLYVDESEYQTSASNNNSDTVMLYPPTWIGAHPSLGERIAETLVPSKSNRGNSTSYKN